MQNAKDTFYAALRDRLAMQFPAMTVVVRGQVRPAVVVEENEIVATEEWADSFVLRWLGCDVKITGPMVMETMRCEIWYATDGSKELAGVDRGRKMAAMNAVLTEILEPRLVVKKNFSMTPAVAMGTNVFWSAAMFSDVKVRAERLERTATVDVMAYREAGE